MPSQSVTKHYNDHWSGNNHTSPIMVWSVWSVWQIKQLTTIPILKMKAEYCCRCCWSDDFGDHRNIFSLDIVATNHTSHQRPMCRPRHCHSASWYQRNLRCWSPSLYTFVKVTSDYKGLPICHRRYYLITFPASGNRTNLPSTVNSTLLTSVWGRKEERESIFFIFVSVFETS